MNISSQIVQYRTVTAPSLNLLDQAVNELLSKGFVVYGHPYEFKGMAAQAMIKPTPGAPDKTQRLTVA